MEETLKDPKQIPLSQTNSCKDEVKIKIESFIDLNDQDSFVKLLLSI